MKKLCKTCYHIITLTYVVVIAACNSNESTVVIVKTKNNIDSITSTQSNSQKIATDVLTANQQILTAIKNRDYKTFATFIHPVKGIRFSPNAYLDPVANQTLTAEQFADLTSKNWRQQLIWETDMEGTPIRLTVGKYFSKYLNDVDFSHAPQVAFNKILRSEIDRNVMKEVYGKYSFVDNHFPGFEKKYGEMDWLSLRLVFDTFNNKYYLIGIIRDQWEI